MMYHSWLQVYYFRRDVPDRHFLGQKYIYTSWYTRRCRVNKVKKNVCCTCTPSSLVATDCHSLYPVITRCHLYQSLSSVIARRHTLLPVLTRSYPFSPFVNRSHPSSPATTRHPLSHAVTRCDLPSSITICFALRASHWYQTRRILVNSGEMLIWGFWDGIARAKVYCVDSWTMQNRRRKTL